MRARRLLPLLLVLALVAVGATGCFSSKLADTTVSNEVTIGQGTTAATVDPTGGAGTEETTTEETGQSTTGPESSTEESTGEAETGETESGESDTVATSDGEAGGDVAAGKTSFTPTCGGCHTLKDAGTSGAVGPKLDELAPLTAERVAQKIEKGGGGMPADLLQGEDAANVAAYVASVAGK
jgi:mono/diheme cytochrome c family protein